MHAFFVMLTADLINEVKLKLHGLRTSYGHELKMEATKKIDGQPYMSKWQWYRQLSFLKEAMCFRSRSGSMSSATNTNGGRTRMTRRRGRRGQPQDLFPHASADDMDGNNHSDGYYMDHEVTDVKILAMDHTSGDSGNGNGGPVHAYARMEPEYDHHPTPPQAHHATTAHNAHHLHPGHHSQSHHPGGLVHLVHMDDPPHPHHLPAGGNGGPEIMQGQQDPHVPVVTYRSRESVVSTASSTMTRHDSASNLPLMCLASTSSGAGSTPDKQQQQVGEDLTTSRSIPSACNCRCRSTAAQSAGERLGRLVEETFSNLHPEYHEMARWEIQQILGKYLQKPLP